MPEVNYWAVLVAAIANMVLGFLWYGPVFGKTWMRLMGWGPDRMAQMGEAGKKAAHRGYMFATIASLVTAYILSHMISYSENFNNVEGLSVGLQTGFWLWLGFVAPVTLGSVLWEGKSWKLWCFNNGYNLAQLLLMGSILATWK